MGLLRPSVESLRSLGNWTQTFRWNVSIIKPPVCLIKRDGGGNSLYSSRAWTDYLNGGGEELNFRAESVTVPEKETETMEIQIRTAAVRQEGMGKYNSPITLTLAETVNPVALDFLSDWQESAFRTADGALGTQRYKSYLEAELGLFLLDCEDNPYYMYHLIGCQIATGTVGELDGASADPLKPAIGIFFDYFTRKALNNVTKGAPKSSATVHDYKQLQWWMM